MQDFIQLAEQLADEAGQIIRPYFRSGVDVESKSDETPVTIADKAVEARLREIIEQHRPDDGIIGEEYGIKDSATQYTWVLDPIDGTKSFIAGRPTFGTLIALCEDGVPVLGIIDQPILKERWIGAKGQPTMFNGEIVKTRKCNSLNKAFVASTTPIMFLDRGVSIEKASKSVLWGGDCYSYGLLANGGLDAVIESDMGTHDYAAMPPIINGAGGLMCDWEGKDLNILNPEQKSTVLAVGDKRIKQEILTILRY